MPEGFASTPEPPYYAVIFTSRRTEADDGYEAMAQAMYELALKQPGCLGAESTRGQDGLGITVSYFVDQASICAWRQNARHLVAQRLGKTHWYSHYELRVAKVERAYSGPGGGKVSGHALDQAVKITVCEFPDEQEFKERAWAALADYVGAVRPSIVILPEMPFCNWIFVGDTAGRGGRATVQRGIHLVG